MTQNTRVEPENVLVSLFVRWEHDPAENDQVKLKVCCHTGGNQSGRKSLNRETYTVSHCSGNLILVPTVVNTM